VNQGLDSAKAAAWDAGREFPPTAADSGEIHRSSVSGRGVIWKTRKTVNSQIRGSRSVFGARKTQSPFSRTMPARRIRRLAASTPRKTSV